MATFPTLSREVEWEITEEPEDSTIKSPYEDGYTHTRPRYTKDRGKWTGVTYKYLNTIDRDVLKAFMATVRMGAVAFDWVNPDNNVTYSVRFDPPPKITYLATGHYYQATMGFSEV
jgi:hypothetical protein